MAARRPLPAAPATPPRPARPCGRRRSAPRRRGRRPSGPAAARCGASAARQRSRVPFQAGRALDPGQRDRVGADRRPERRHPARRRLDHREPHALVLRGHDDRVGGVDPVRDLLRGHAAEREQRHVARRLARAVEALQRPRRLVREQQVRARRGRARAARAPPRAGSGGSGRGRSPQGRIATRRVRAAPGTLRAERARHRGGQRHERERGARERARARVQQVVAVQRHDERAQPRQQRRPGDEPEVHVHDVERLPR